MAKIPYLHAAAVRNKRSSWQFVHFAKQRHKFDSGPRVNVRQPQHLLHMSMARDDAIHLDGRTGEGGGQLVRIAIALASVACKPVKITDVRGNRPGPRGGGTSLHKHAPPPKHHQTPDS